MECWLLVIKIVTYRFSSFIGEPPEERRLVLPPLGLPPLNANWGEIMQSAIMIFKVMDVEHKYFIIIKYV